MFGIHQGAWGKIAIILLVVIFITWAIFRLFPTSLDASSIVTVFGGILGIVWLIIELNKHFTEAT